MSDQMMFDLAPLVGNDDDLDAHLAACDIQLKRVSRKQAVLAYLKERYGQWVNGYELTAPSVGGSEGLRRLRELSDNGYVIEKRAPSNGRTTWQYKLTSA